MRRTMVPSIKPTRRAFSCADNPVDFMAHGNPDVAAPSSPRSLMTALLVPLCGSPAPPAAACAFDSGAAGLFDGNFVAVHPKASIV